jgi:Heavy metal binding domain
MMFSSLRESFRGRDLRPWIVIVLVATVVQRGAVLVPLAHAQDGAVTSTVFICPMHPDVRGVSGQKCPRCGMALVPSGGPSSDVLVDLEITPPALQPTRQGTLSILLRDKESGVRISDLEPVSERPLHLFVISRDLAYFAHLHPAPLADGSLRMPFTVPHAGFYQLYFDFMPRGGTPQFVQRSFGTAGFKGRVSSARLATDVSPKTDKSISVELQLPVDGLVAGRTESFRCSLTDSKTHRPVVDLEQYLGASGHVFAVAEDLEYAAHSHPVSDFSDSSGPNVVFEALFPRPGMYRVWAQFKRFDQVSVVSFTVSVRPE